MEVKSRLLLQWRRLGAERPVDLETWRVWFSRALILLGVVLFPLGTAFSLPHYISKGYVLLAPINVLVWVVLLVRSFSRTGGYLTNALVVMVLLYIMTATNFIVLGPGYARPAWLVACAVMAALMFGIRGAFIATVLNAVLLLILYEAIGPENREWAAAHQASYYNWLIFIVNTSLLTITSSLPVGYMLGRLDRSLQYEREAQKRLSEESERLKDANEALAREIELRRKTEADLREKEAFQRILFEEAPDGYYIFDEEGRIVDINQTMAKIQGIGKEEVIGKRFSEIGVLRKDEIPGTVELFKKQIQGQCLEPFERILQRKNGSLVTVELNAYPITVGGRRYLLGVSRDLTMRKRVEEEKKQLERRLVHAQKMEAIGTLAGGIAHDFNNILAAVIGYVQVAQADMDNGEKLERHLSQVLKAGMRARELVQQILTFSRRESDQELGPVQVKAVARDVLKMMRATLPSTVEIRQHLESDAFVLADSVKIYQALMNLCANAGHAMRDQGGVIEVRVTDVIPDNSLLKKYPELGRGPHVEIVVKDTGPGIAPDVINRIFEPYFTTKAPGEGSGLGLSIVHGVVKNSGGVLNVQSEPGRGASFQIYLPAADTDMPAAGEQAAALPTGNEKILLVDDEPEVAEVGKMLLERLGYQVVASSSSVEALELFEKDFEKYDLVVTDMTMPKITGKDLAGKLMKIRADIPIILCTGYSHQIDKEAALQMGIKAYVMKPVNLNEIARTVRNVLDEALSGRLPPMVVN